MSEIKEETVAVVKKIEWKWTTRKEKPPNGLKIGTKEVKQMNEWKLGFGSGQAKCRVCDKLITNEQQNIKLVNARVSGQLHSNPFDCSEERIEMLGLEDIEGEVNE